jgi:hypothetical protein
MAGEPLGSLQFWRGSGPLPEEGSGLSDLSVTEVPLSGGIGFGFTESFEKEARRKRPYLSHEQCMRVVQ